MVSEEIQQIIDDIKNNFSNVPFSSKPPTSILMGLSFYKAMLTHPKCLGLSEEDVESIVKRLESGEELQLENGMVDKMNSDGVIVRGYL